MTARHETDCPFVFDKKTGLVHGRKPNTRIEIRGQKVRVGEWVEVDLEQTIISPGERSLNAVDFIPESQPRKGFWRTLFRK